MSLLVTIFVKKDKKSVIIRTTLLYLIAIYFFGLSLNYLLTGELIFSVAQWLENFKNKVKIIALMFMVYNFVVISLLVIFYFKWRNLQNQHNLITLKLEDISSLWTKYNSKPISKKRTKLQNELDHQDIDFIKRSRSYTHFYSKYMFDGELIKHIEYYQKPEIYLMIKIIDLYEKFGDCSSVASLYKKDSEKEELNQLLKQAYGGEANYQALEKISLGEHVRNVLEISLNKHQVYKEDLEEAGYTRTEVVLSALLHDVGKIFKGKQSSGDFENIENTMINGTHTEVSIKWTNMIVDTDEIYIKNIIQAIKSHHYASEPNDLLANILFKADKEAREKETEKIINELKAEQKKAIEQEQQEFEKNRLQKQAVNESVDNELPLPIETDAVVQEEALANQVGPLEETRSNAILHVELEDTTSSFVDEVVRELKKNVNIIKEGPGEKPILSIEDIEKSNIYSLTSGTDLFVSYAHLKQVVQSISGEHYDKKKMGSFTKELMHEGVIIKSSSNRDMHELKIAFNGVPFKEGVYLYRIPLQKILVTQDFIESTKSPEFKIFKVTILEVL